jgi:hypothetical protein
MYGTSSTGFWGPSRNTSAVEPEEGLFTPSAHGASTVCASKLANIMRLALEVIVAVFSALQMPTLAMLSVWP